MPACHSSCGSLENLRLISSEHSLLLINGRALVPPTVSTPTASVVFLLQLDQIAWHTSPMPAQRFEASLRP